MPRLESYEGDGAPIEVHDTITGKLLGTVMPIQGAQSTRWVYRTASGYQSSFTKETREAAEDALRLLTWMRQGSSDKS